MLPEPEECCFEYGFGSFQTPCCLNIITCTEHENKYPPGSVHPPGGNNGRIKGKCPIDPAEAHNILSARTDTEEECCFTYGFGSFQTPCCLNIISCTEHENRFPPGSRQPTGGNNGRITGKCPTNPAEAHDLLAIKFPETD